MQALLLEKTSLLRFKTILYLVLILEAVFLFLMVKSFSFSFLFVLFTSLPFLLQRYPEFGFSVAMTSNILLLILFDFLKIEFPMLVLFAYLLLVVGGTCFYFVQRGFESGIKIGTPIKLALLIGVLMLVGLVYSTDKSYGLNKFIFYVLSNLLLISLPLLFTNDTKKIENIIRFTFILGVVLAILASIIALNTPSSLRFHPSESVNPIWLSRSLGISLLAAIFLISMTKSTFSKLLILSTIPLFLYPMFRSWSRAPLLGVWLCFYLYFILQPNIKLWKKISSGVIIASVGLVFIIQSTSQLAARLQTPLAQEWSTAFRLFGWLKGWQDFKMSPLMGIGTGSYSLDLPYTPFKYPHNLLIEIASENGILGLLLIIPFIFIITKIGIENITLYHRAGQNKYTQLSITIFTIFCYCLWNSMFSGNISSNEIIWLSAGLLYVLNLSYKRIQRKGEI